MRKILSAIVSVIVTISFAGMVFAQEQMPEQKPASATGPTLKQGVAKHHKRHHRKHPRRHHKQIKEMKKREAAPAPAPAAPAPPEAPAAR